LTSSDTKHNRHLVEIIPENGVAMDSFRRFRRLVLAVAVIALLVVATLPAARSTPFGLPVIIDLKMTLDESFAAVASRVPSFGGMYLQGNVLMVYLTNPSQQAAAVGAIQTVFGPDRIPAAGVQILPARYGFTQLA